MKVRTNPAKFTRGRQSRRGRAGIPSGAPGLPGIQDFPEAPVSPSPQSPRMCNTILPGGTPRRVLFRHITFHHRGADPLQVAAFRRVAHQARDPVAELDQDSRQAGADEPVGTCDEGSHVCRGGVTIRMRTMRCSSLSENTPALPGRTGRPAPVTPRYRCTPP